MYQAGFQPAVLRGQHGCSTRQARSLCYDLRMKNFWLVKQEPSSYSWADFTAEGKTNWTGVRNYTARNNLRRMRKGDEVLFYHSGEDKAVIGIAKVMRGAYPDPTAKEGDWSAVDLAPIKSLRGPVTLQQIRAAPQLKKIQLVRQSRLSVMPVTAGEFRAIVAMGS
jgi:predicted RNA-binding protein with PUA-like domain